MAKAEAAKMTVEAVTLGMAAMADLRTMRTKMMLTTKVALVMVVRAKLAALMVPREEVRASLGEREG